MSWGFKIAKMATNPTPNIHDEVTVTGKEINLAQQEMYFNKTSFQKRRPRRPYSHPTRYDSSDNENKEKLYFQKVKNWVEGLSYQ